MIFDDKLWKITPPPHPPKNRKNFEDLQIFTIKSGHFLPFWGQKYISTSINFSIFGRDFGRIMDILPYYTDGFFGSIFDLFPKKTDFQVKKSKKTESPKMVSKRL